MVGAVGKGGEGKDGSFEPRCHYKHCPTSGQKRFVKITSATSARGRDWQALVGMTLCNPCYCWYGSHGTLERTNAAQVESQAQNSSAKSHPGKKDSAFSPSSAFSQPCTPLASRKVQTDCLCK